jgi:hypothetical protein
MVIRSMCIFLQRSVYPRTAAESFYGGAVTGTGGAVTGTGGAVTGTGGAVCKGATPSVEQPGGRGFKPLLD